MRRLRPAKCGSLEARRSHGRRGEVEEGLGGAFQSMRTKGQKGRVSFTQLAADYRKLKDEDPEEFAKIHRMGTLASRRHRELSVPSFGRRSTRAVRRRLANRAPPQVTVSGAMLPAGSLASGGHRDESQGLSVSMTVDLSAQLREVRKLSRRGQLARKEVQDKTQRRLQDFVAKHEVAGIEKFLSAVPQAMPLASSLKMIPDLDLSVL